MNRCLKIVFGDKIPEGFLRTFVLKHARKLNLEGTAQMAGDEGKVSVIVCGQDDKVDSFLDLIHKGAADYRPDNVEIEPFLKAKDYRGVFRVIE